MIKSTEVRIRKICNNWRIGKYNILIYIWIDNNLYKLIDDNLSQKDVLITINKLVEENDLVTSCIYGPIITLNNDKIHTESHVKNFFGDSWIYKNSILD
jgi:hypothetical protein